ncbi:MAG: spermidine synthase [Candidatus Berkiella sp.]
MLAFSASIFLSAFLLFIIQPLLAKTLLPLFGGSPAVWLSNLVFYQSALLIGYAYAYFVTKLPRLSWQAILHFALLVLSLFILPITPAKELAELTWWQPLTVFAVLGTTLLIPVVALSATSPLLQYWYYHSYHSDFPYRFYALSNFGSLLGLFAFPLLLEPLLGLKFQLTCWSIGYGIFFMSCSTCAFMMLKRKAYLEKSLENTSSIAFGTFFSWLLLTAMSCALLLTTTQVMLQNVVGFPLLWVVPLALYLISFILVFYQSAIYVRSFWTFIYLALAAAVFYLPSHHQLTLLVQVIVFSLLLFSGCMICHGELYRLKPNKQHLTFYYLMIALGGVLGGIFVNLISPLIFNEWWDFYGVIFGIFLYLICVPISQASYPSEQPPTLIRRIALPVSLFIFVALVAVLVRTMKETHKDIIYIHRNFLGTFEVSEKYKNDEDYLRVLTNGNIMHGQQYMNKSLRTLATTYYSKKSGIGLGIDFLRQQNINSSKNLRIGAIGLGTGTIAALAHKGDEIRFYELDPDIEKTAKKYFYFLNDTPAKTEVVIGDGRLSLMKEWQKNGSQQFDIIAIDAFSGDAIPLHLLTKEAFDIYLSHLKPNGILAFHISSRYLDLYPPLQAISSQLHLFAYLAKHDPSKEDRWLSNSEWLLISRQPQIGLFLLQRGAIHFRHARIKDVWTDDFNYLLPIIRW